MRRLGWVSLCSVARDRRVELFVAEAGWEARPIGLVSICRSIRLPHGIARLNQTCLFVQIQTIPFMTINNCDRCGRGKKRWGHPCCKVQKNRHSLFSNIVSHIPGLCAQSHASTPDSKISGVLTHMNRSFLRFAHGTAPDVPITPENVPGARLPHRVVLEPYQVRLITGVNRCVRRSISCGGDH